MCTYIHVNNLLVIQIYGDYFLSVMVQSYFNVNCPILMTSDLTDSILLVICRFGVL
jgi:hypothetical protein